MSTAMDASSRDDWAAERLTAFMSWLPGVAVNEMARRATKWATESLDAEVGALLGPGSVEAVIGLPAGADVRPGPGRLGIAGTPRRPRCPAWDAVRC